jgi:Tfp pilus assembly protein PilF
LPILAPQWLPIAEAKTPVGFWGSLKSWTPARLMRTDDKPKLKNPGKLHLAYARWQEQLGNIVEARESYELALGDDPKSIDAVLGLARLDQLNGRTAEAEQRYLKVLKLKPNDPNVLDAVGQFYASQERWNEAIGMLKQAMLIAPQATTYRYDLAVVLARSGRITESLPHFSRTVGDAEAHYNIGYILYEQGDLGSAERQFQQALLARPNLAEAQRMYDVVRRDQAQRQMFADNRPPAPQDGTQTAYQSDAGQPRLTNPNYPPVRHEPIDPRYQVASSVRASAEPFNYRTTGPGISTTDLLPVTQSSVRAELPTRQSPAPWQTAPVFDNDRNPVAKRSPYNDTQWSNPANYPPATPTMPPSTSGRQQPTSEQLEQWRNQLSPGNIPVGR